MDLETMFKCNDIFTIRSLFDKYMNKYPSIELYIDYYRMLEGKIVNGSSLSNLYEYIVDYLFHDSYQNVYVNLCEILRYMDICHTTKIIPEENLEFYRMILELNNWPLDRLLDFFEFYKNKRIYMSFYNDLKIAKTHSYNDIMNNLTDLTLFEPDYDVDSVSVYDLRNVKYKFLVRSSRKFEKYSCYYKSCYSIITSIHNRTFGRENDSLSFDYGYLCADINKILHISEKDLLSKYSDEHDCGTPAPNRILNLYSLTEFDSSWSEIQILNTKSADEYKCLKPDFIISYSEQIKPKILKEAQRLGIPVVIVNNKSLESLDGEWLENELYNSYYDRNLKNSMK